MATSDKLVVGKGSWKEREVGSLMVGKIEMKLERIKFENSNRCSEEQLKFKRDS